ncbi:hypothetical protein FB567DRAFT_592556 [Paraphoma chrysanthemicola]|uniref:Uncharacterized protein n=1 Tax=Paraphoma chrysanthemicola TaxID=798071 RepID=A0A8K0R690_9PLEO|nr:hypothetical protein FB567DRAFT_592556 [Paraphoma chrysanthemicola]
MANAEAAPPPASEPLPPVDEAPVEDPPAEGPLAAEPEPPAETAPEPAQADEVPGVVEDDPQDAALPEPEPAVAAPEAPTVVEPEPLSVPTIEEPAAPEGPVENVQRAVEDVKEDIKETAEDVKEEAKETSESVKVAEVAVPDIAAPSVVSKKRKFGGVKARVSAKVLPKVLGVGVPKEAVPLVTLLRKKKKNGEDVGKLVNMCMVALGA